MKKEVTKTTTYLSEDGSVELYHLSCNGQTETYLRRGYNIEKVEGDANLMFTPEPPTTMDLTKPDVGWSQKNGLKIRQTPKQLK